MPAGKLHIVEQGQSFSNLAFENGLFWETMWNDSANAELRNKRESPFVLEPGDQVFIPAIRQATKPAETGKKNVFRLRGVPARLRVVVRAEGEPMASQPYLLEVEGSKARTGVTGPDGLVDTFVPPNTVRARLTVGEGTTQRTYDLALHRLNPVGYLEGLQARLKNLGYYRGQVDARPSDLLTEAIRQFQTDNGMEATGEVTNELHEKLRSTHGC